MELVTKQPSGCWEFANDCFNGYGAFWLDGKNVAAHRVSYTLFVGPVGDKCVCHHCDNRRCVRPDHLFLSDRAGNNLDAVLKLRHAFGERNGHAKLSAKKVAAIKADTGAQTTIARRHGISPCHVSRIKSGKRRHLG